MVVRFGSFCRVPTPSGKSLKVLDVLPLNFKALGSLGNSVCFLVILKITMDDPGKY